MNVVRYEIYLANLDLTLGAEIHKTRPVVVISQDAMNHHLDAVMICPLTTTIHRSWRSRIQVSCSGRPSEIAVDQIRTIRKIRLIKRLDKLSRDRAEELRQCIDDMYGSQSL